MNQFSYWIQFSLFLGIWSMIDYSTWQNCLMTRSFFYFSIKRIVWKIRYLLKQHTYNSFTMEHSDWNLKDPYIVMLYWFQQILLSAKVNWYTNKSGVKYPLIKTRQDGSVRKAWDCNRRVTKSSSPRLNPC